MTRNELIKEVKKYFQLKELVCPHCLETYGEKSWQFLSTELLSIILTIRTKILKVPMIVNSKQAFTQRGLRCNMCRLVRNKKQTYMSAHNLGKAIDFHTNEYTAEECRQKIKDNIDLFEYPIRLEEEVSWVHVDCYTLDSNQKLTTFTA